MGELYIFRIREDLRLLLYLSAILKFLKINESLNQLALP